MLIPIEADVKIPVQCETGGVAAEPEAAPTFRVIGPAGDVGGGTCSQVNTGAITAGTATTPIVLTSNNHGLQVGNIVTIAGVGGLTGANATFRVSAVTANTFTLEDSVGGGSYTAGGTFTIAGLYHATLDSAIRSALEKGKTYLIVVNYRISSVDLVFQAHFTAA